MNRKGRPWHFIVVAVLILVFAVTSLFGVSYQYGDIKTTYIKGVSDIRFGIDIRGGVSVTFVPAEEIDATDEQLDAAQTVINERLIGLGVTDYESYIDYNNDQIIVRFPWRSDETDFDPQQAIDEIGTTAQMVFREGSTADGAQILTGDEVQSASPHLRPERQLRGGPVLYQRRRGRFCRCDHPPGGGGAASSASGWMTRTSAPPPSTRPSWTATPSSRAILPWRKWKRWPTRSTPARCPLR